MSGTGRRPFWGKETFDAKFNVNCISAGNLIFFKPRQLWPLRHFSESLFRCSRKPTPPGSRRGWKVFHVARRTLMGKRVVKRRRLPLLKYMIFQTKVSPSFSGNKTGKNRYVQDRNLIWNLFVLTFWLCAPFSRTVCVCRVKNAQSEIITWNIISFFQVGS